MRCDVQVHNWLLSMALSAYLVESALAGVPFWWVVKVVGPRRGQRRHGCYGLSPAAW